MDSTTIVTIITTLVTIVNTYISKRTNKKIEKIQDLKEGDYIDIVNIDASGISINSGSEKMHHI